MLSFFFGLAILAIALVSPISASAPTDSYTDADVPQSGYLPNHNMDPAVVDSAQFGLLWKIQFNAKEQFYAKPLVYTPLAGTAQLVFLASSQNWIRTLNAKTGALLNSRQVHTPFLQSEIGCTDIPNTIGIIGTPVIDPASDIAYFYSKTYIPNFRTAGNTGVYNGVYYFHGVNVNTLADAFPPLLIDGSAADNAPQKYFVGGVQLQRPSLLQVGSVVYGAFGSSCDLYNYTGLVIGVDVNQQQIVTQFATESGPLTAQTNVWSQNGGGGQGGIWMSGMGLASDGNRLFFVTGNGDAHENAGTPATGTSGCKTLGEAAVNLNIGDGGVLRLADYFQPYDYENMDGGDQDFGSGGIILLDPTVFRGTGVNRMAVTGGKNGKVYILNADNMGGYKLGPGQGDNIVQTLATNQPLFGGYGSYPLEGGYIYSTPDGDATYAYKLGFSAGGTPVFSQAGQSNEISAGRVGVGIPTITSYKGNPGTAILWNTDPNVGLRAWYAVPQNNVLKTINLPAIGGANKFQRPAFGDSRLYVTSSAGAIYCLGSPVNLPLNCTSPVEFGDVALGSKANTTVSCTANIAITSVNGMTVGNPDFIVNNASLPTGRLAAGATFSFPVTWDLTGDIEAADPNATYNTVTPGIQSTALTIFTTNGLGGYSTQFPVTLAGTEVSQNAFVVTSPKTLDFAGVVLLPNQPIPTVTLPFTIANAGLTPLTIEGYAFTNDAILDNPTYHNVTYFSNGTAEFGTGFSSNDLPPLGTVINPNSALDVDTIFYPYDGVQTYYSYLLMWTSGGMSEVTLAGTASTAPIANFSISTSEGGWLPDSNLIMDFGDVAPASTSQLQIRICNNGGSVLDISKSKPPNGVFYLQNSEDLHEEQAITIGACAYGTVTFTPNAEVYNEEDQTFNNTWTLNTDDLNFGVHIVEIIGTVVSNKVGPTNSSGDTVYTYLGCFLDSEGGQGPRLLPHQLYNGNNNSNANCQELCYTGTPSGYVFEGTEYEEQCYCGNTPPSEQWQVADQGFCTFSCTGNSVDACGGNGGYISIYYDATRYTPGTYESTGPVGGPVTVNSTGSYNYAGCFSEATTGRALSARIPPAPADGFTIELCAAACQGYQYFGMEYSNECYCGNTLGYGSVNQASTDPNTNGCSMICAGNATEYCGGPGRLDLYQSNGSAPIPTPTSGPTVPTPTGGPVIEQVVGDYVYLGCYQDNVDGLRALSALQNPESGALNTPDVCATACVGFQYMGVEYSGECYCDDAIGGNNTVAPGGDDPNANGCDMTCNGNSSEYCGGPNRLNMYILNPNATSSSPTSTAAPSAPTATPTGPRVIQTAGSYVYAGCYADNTNGRALSALVNPESGVNNTVEACAAACSGYRYMGVEYGNECYCDNVIGGGNGIASGGNNVLANGCSMTCPGNSSEYCGGRNRLNLYMLGGNATVSVSTPTPTPTPAGPVTVGDFDAWSYMGCYTEATGNRALSDLENPISGVAVTVEACGTACSDYAYFGVEYSRECYCGNKINNGSVLATGLTVAATMCDMTCAGNITEYCGGPSRLNMYSQTLEASTASATLASAPSATLATSPAPTPTGPITVTELAGYTYLGCYNEPPNARALSGFEYAIPGTNNSVENCAVGCTGYEFFGVEYTSQCFCGNTIAEGSVAQNGSTSTAVGQIA
ncbi:hypothetical protein MMC32_000335 [Xylographa parallela]|nr:hypothetical protein [Xylographa parallela]